MPALSPPAKQQFFDNAGNPAAGYLLYTYAAGTTAPLVTYSNKPGTSANPNPIVLDARGEATIFLDPALVYDYVLKSPDGSLIWTQPDVSAFSLTGAAADSVAAMAQAVKDGVNAAVAQAQSDANTVLQGLGYLPPVAFASGLNVTSTRFTVTYNGNTYAAVNPPFTTTGTFDASKWRVVQGVTVSDLIPINAALDEAKKANTAQAQVQPFWSRVRAGSADVYVFIGSDSTGNETWEWPYLMAQWIATKAPSHTVKFRYFNDMAQAWDAYSTVSAGSGTKTIFIDCCAVAGMNLSYLEGGREKSVFTGNDYVLGILNYGHNTGTTSREHTVTAEFTTGACNAMLFMPNAGILVTRQNPRRDLPDGPLQTAGMAAAWSSVAGSLGLGMIDVYSAYQSLTDLAPYYLDDTHPNAAGQAVWLEAVKAAMFEQPTAIRSATSFPNPLSVIKQNFVRNPLFADWTGASPSGWTFTNCTPSKNTGVSENGLYGMQIDIGAGANPKMSADLSIALPRLRGKKVTALVRLWRPTGLDLLAGRISLIASSGGSSASVVSGVNVASGGYIWVMASLVVPRNSTSLRLDVYTGASSGTDAGKRLFVYSAFVGESGPGAVDPRDEQAKSISQFFSPDNVGIMSSGDGTLSATTNDIAISGSTSGKTDVYINLPGLVAGQQYTLTWDWVSDSLGNTTPHGGLYVRNGYNGGSSTIANAGWAAETLTFTAPAGPVSIWAYGGGGVTAWTVNDWSVVKV